MPTYTIPEFEPHPLLRGGHSQTLAGNYLPGGGFPYRAVQRRLTLADGDIVVLHDDQPEYWQPGGRVALLLHGLAGCHQSPYMIRIAGKLNQVGVRVFRMDHRDCGAGVGLARKPYNAGRSEDALAALREISELCPGSPMAIAGFSLSANIVLKMLGEDPSALPSQLDRAMAVNPPVDLARSVRALNGPLTRFYDRHFVALLYRQVTERSQRLPAERFQFPRKPRRLLEFDDWFTAPMSGYQNAANYYARCSAAQFVPAIEVETLILTAKNDPLVPVEQFEELKLPGAVQLHVAPSGGHLGYLSRNGHDGDRRWMDWRVVEWVTR